MMVALGQQMTAERVLADRARTEQLANEFIEYLGRIETDLGRDAVVTQIANVAQFFRDTYGSGSITHLRAVLLTFIPAKKELYALSRLLLDMVTPEASRQAAAEMVAAYKEYEASKPNPRVTVVSERPLPAATPVAPPKQLALTCDKSLWRSTVDWVKGHCWVA
jgi:hypothetical protein